MSSNSSTELESASECVGRIVELVENVLQYLPYSGIPNAQYICHQWKDIINTSKIVRARIFLAPHRLTNILEYAKANRRDRRAQRGRYYYHAKPIRGKQWHPFLHGVLAVPTMNPDWLWDKPLYLSMEDAFGELANRPAGNWQNMLCCQPPVSRFSHRGRFERFAATLSKRPDEYGITMGQIRGLARRLLGNTEKTELEEKWVWTALSDLDGNVAVKRARFQHGSKHCRIVTGLVASWSGLQGDFTSRSAVGMASQNIYLQQWISCLLFSMYL